MESYMSDWNTGIIEEFRQNGGKVGGMFEGAPLLLLHHIGARTGTERVSPLVYLPVGDRWAIFASKGGADTNPDWFHNLMANPEIKIEIGDEVVSVAARQLEGDERAPIWERQKQERPNFADYERKTPRSIPVILLERI